LELLAYVTVGAMARCGELLPYLSGCTSSCVCDVMHIGSLLLLRQDADALGCSMTLVPWIQVVLRLSLWDVWNSARWRSLVVLPVCLPTLRKLSAGHFDFWPAWLYYDCALMRFRCIGVLSRNSMVLSLSCNCVGSLLRLLMYCVSQQY
jgi:hypothetical protein